MSTDQAEKWKARAREVAPDPGFAALRLRIAAALSAAYAEGYNDGQRDGWQSTADAIRARGASHD